MRRGTPRFRLHACEAAVEELQARIPFRFGDGVIRRVPTLLVRAEIEAAGKKRAAGLSAECLLPGRAEGDTAAAYRRQVEEAILAFRTAREVFLEAGSRATAAHELWESACPRAVEKGMLAGLDAATCVAGSSLLERAAVDAVSRLKGLSLHEMLRQDLLGMRTSKAVPEEPVSEFSFRHTIGVLDPLTVNEIPPAARVADSIPQALEEHIESYGFRSFKVELSGEAERDLERLTRLAVLLHQRCRGGYRVALDGRERFRDAAPLEGLLEALKTRPYGPEFLSSIQHFEGLFPRVAALEPAIADEVSRISKWAPVVVDDEGDTLDFVERAVELGYRGFAHSNRRGLFRSLQARASIVRAQGKSGGPSLFQTGEDAASPPIVGFQQELAALSALGLSACGSNAHQFFHGLDHIPTAEATAALVDHADLYEQRGKSVFIRIEEGRIAARSIHAAGFGYSCQIAFAERTPLEAWSASRVGPEPNPEGP
ncbi:MAG: hypothetical protein ACUVYA_06670 [Planctomycetota bacterium]